MSSFKIMWLVVMFDLPTKSKKDRRRYQWFHNELDKEGYMMIQYSVYGKIFSSNESAKYGKKRIKDFVSKNMKRGNIRMLSFTDKQFADMEVIVGEKPKSEKREHVQLLLF